jgi:NTP pyrophosphatase (non-canonical NTP hydrolase)
MNALQDVATERLLQDEKWGDQSGHPDLFWNAILGEEVGEVHRALLKQDGERSGDLRHELVQVAAVAVAWVEALDSRGSA